MATPKRGAERSLEASIERLSETLERFADRLDAVPVAGGADGDALMRHVRRYVPFYALAAVFVLLIVLLPTRKDGPASQSSEITSTDGGPSIPGAEPGDLAAPDGPTRGPIRRGAVAGGPGGGADVPSGVPRDAAGPRAAFDPLAWTATGKTIGGFDCNNGVRQLPWSRYAVPCHPRWTGGNGGATSRGVSSKEIVIVRRTFPETANSRAVASITEQAGFASADTVDAVRTEFRKYFSKVFELWGRKIRFIDWESQFGDGTAEAQGRGKEGACADANVIANELKAFGVMGGGQAFSECAAERKLMVFDAAAYYPETFYRKYHPYLWAGVMECERIGYQTAEYLGKRLAGRPAKWAKSVTKNKPRKFALYIPSNDGYQTCGDIMDRELKRRYNNGFVSRYNYILDISRLPDEATKAVVQFNAAGATGIVLACDPFSPIFLTQSAKSQNYYPEWLLIGVAVTDADNVPRLWDKDEVEGSLFGMSQLGSTEKILGPKGEAPVTYRIATGTKIPEGTTGDYYALVRLFSVLQATGLHVTPETVAASYPRLPPGGAPTFEVGYTSFRDGPDGKAGARDHTAVDDSREVWWSATRTSYDGEKGTYVETYGGKRFRNGQWPKEEPPVFR